jgi:hypothetical protein
VELDPHLALSVFPGRPLDGLFQEVLLGFAAPRRSQVSNSDEILLREEPAYAPSLSAGPLLSGLDYDFAHRKYIIDQRYVRGYGQRWPTCECSNGASGLRED